jgi:tRNA/tmRNA/rRNA uracil-C5-methylase (TrmA/RlmC/RlmD family)
MLVGDLIELIVEKPAAGGRMLARHEGRVVLVHGAIPGERIRARVTRVERQLAFATTTDIAEASPDRRTPLTDLACGGTSYAHVVYPRQLQLKSEIVKDAFARLGRLPIPAPLEVRASPERGYRMRARFHVRDRRIGFYKEGTHDLCDAASTGQVLDQTIDAVSAAVDVIGRSARLTGVEVAENVRGDQRVLHVQSDDGDVPVSALEAAVAEDGLTGCSSYSAGGVRVAGVPVVSDPVAMLTSGRAGAGMLERHAESFFQANRFLLPDLVTDVLDSVLPDGPVTDLYAGVGLFSVSLAHAGREGINAVEGDRTSARDLMANASACGAAVRVVIGSVEAYLSSGPPKADTVIVDPPRTGISRNAIDALVRARPRRLVYVSCDPPTMARDAARFVAGGYELTSLRAFDLFPNTPHVESLGVFDLRSVPSGGDKRVE